VVLLDQILRRLPTSYPVVLVNLLPPEQLENMRQKFSQYDLAYVYGDYSREDIMRKANVRAAAKAIILAGRLEGETAAQADQRTLLTALTLRSLNPQLRILVELHLRENRPYLERAGVDEVMIRGQYDSSLLAGAIATPGLFRIFINLLQGDGQNLWSVEVPARYYGRPLRELAAHLKDHHHALLIGIYSEGRGLSLEDLLSEEVTAVDEFIRRKFAETGMTYLFGRAKVDFQINPPNSLVLGPQQHLVLIAPQKPVL
jgi:voltage-gated potassium channel